MGVSTIMANPLRIGATIPNFPLKTTTGEFNFHDFLNNAELPWTVFFSHPADYTPVCTTELGQCHVQANQFTAMGAKLIGLSCDSLENHSGWTKDVLGRVGCAGDLAYPIIADEERKIVSE